jgi:hypothetical protein
MGRDASKLRRQRQQISMILLGMVSVDRAMEIIRGLPTEELREIQHIPAVQTELNRRMAEHRPWKLK